MLVGHSGSTSRQAELLAQPFVGSGVDPGVQESQQRCGRRPEHTLGPAPKPSRRRWGWDRSRTPLTAEAGHVMLPTGLGAARDRLVAVNATGDDPVQLELAAQVHVPDDDPVTVQDVEADGPAPVVVSWRSSGPRSRPRSRRCPPARGSAGMTTSISPGPWIELTVWP